MPRVEVNHKTLNNSADLVWNYIKKHKSLMNQADTAVDSMIPASWGGNDAAEFYSKWSAIDEKGSVDRQVRENLENFAKALDNCASLYKKAQVDSYRNALGLPKRFF